MLENIRLSFRGIWSHKMRSFLTMLGIIIGIAAIIAIVSTIQGTNEQIEKNLIGSGSNNVKVTLQKDGYDRCCKGALLQHREPYKVRCSKYVIASHTKRAVPKGNFGAALCILNR